MTTETARTQPDMKGGITIAEIYVPEREAVSEAAFLEAIEAFTLDVFGEHPEDAGWWISPTSRKSWQRCKTINSRHDAETAVARQIKGLDVFAVNGLRHAIVLDLDIFGTGRNREAPEDMKAEAAQKISLVLHSHDIPHVHIDSRRGTHTWIRTDFDTPDGDVEALRRLAQAAVADIGKLEGRPKGDSQIRLPFGRYCGRLRSFLGEEYDRNRIAEWLERPERASKEQIASAVAVAPLPTGAERQAALALPPMALGTPVRGFEEWPVCKREKFLVGVEKEGERHHLFNLLAAEAVLHADVGIDELVELLLAIPLNGLSMSSERELMIDARQNAKDVLKRKTAGDPLLSGCGYRNTSSDFVAAFSSHCTEERARTCQLVHGIEPESTAYRDVLRSTLWRGSQGDGRGLGLTSRAVYSDIIRRAHGLPGFLVRAEGRYLECRLRYVTRGAAHRALGRLADPEVGLLRKVESELYELRPAPSPSELRSLEEALGTFRSWDRARERHERHWQRA